MLATGNKPAPKARIQAAGKPLALRSRTHVTSCKELAGISRELGIRKKGVDVSTVPVADLQHQPRAAANRLAATVLSCRNTPYRSLPCAQARLPAYKARRGRSAEHRDPFSSRKSRVGLGRHHRRPTPRRVSLHPSAPGMVHLPGQHTGNHSRGSSRFTGLPSNSLALATFSDGIAASRPASRGDALS